MKHFILTLTLLISSAGLAQVTDLPSDFAPVDAVTIHSKPSQGGADEMYDILNCRPAVLHPDLGMALTISEGGFAGLTQVTIKRFFLGHQTTEGFIVHRNEIPAQQTDGPVVYSGDNFRLAINFFAPPLKDGGQPSTLTVKGQSEKLSCKVVNRYVNY